VAGYAFNKKLQMKQANKKTVKVGGVTLGGGNPIVIQSMTNTDTGNIKATVAQIKALETAGCAIVRLAVCNAGDIKASKEILKKVSVPLVADIQFDYKLAVASADVGYSAIRFNPGNIGSEAKVKEVITACKRNKIPIRIGVNLGSLENDIEKDFGRTADALVASCLRHVVILEKNDFNNIVLSVKASDAGIMVDANRQLYKKTPYPLHLGVTESGIGEYGAIKSAVGIGALLVDGIGDTLRVSLTGDPVDEIAVAKMILKASGKIKSGVEVISCPTCARCKMDLAPIAGEITDYTKDMTKSLKVAIMGCAVNGPGEAKDADICLCGGETNCVIFVYGKKIKTCMHDMAIETLKKEIEKL